MKNKSTVILLAITAIFILLTLGFLVGRNVKGPNITIFLGSKETEAQESLSVFAIDGKIDINIADVAALCELPGIGETIAQRIIQFREENGKFIHISDIMMVDGIGEKTFHSIAELITVGG